MVVVIYFQICIFEPLETTPFIIFNAKHTLWFTFKFVSLNHWKQRNLPLQEHTSSCDLLSNLYLWTIGNNIGAKNRRTIWVVIYFQICIFEPLETTKRKSGRRYICCDLLSNLYLWTIGNNRLTKWTMMEVVVIYFQICIFEPLETTNPWRWQYTTQLWFTFKFVSLNHWKQRFSVVVVYELSCDLLSNLYLWTIGNNIPWNRATTHLVVIYFQICIFEPLETTLRPGLTPVVSLWFTFKFVSLNHWKQRLWKYVICDRVVIYFQICIFEPLETTACRPPPRP